MALFKKFESRKVLGHGVHKIYLSFSVFHYPNWFCRVYEDSWESYVGTGSFTHGFREAYGKTKFEAYRKAINNNLTIN